MSMWQSEWRTSRLCSIKTSPDSSSYLAGVRVKAGASDSVSVSSSSESHWVLVYSALVASLRLSGLSVRRGLGAPRCTGLCERGGARGPDCADWAGVGWYWGMGWPWGRGLGLGPRMGDPLLPRPDVGMDVLLTLIGRRAAITMEI